MPESGRRCNSTARRRGSTPRSIGDPARRARRRDALDGGLRERRALRARSGAPHGPRTRSPAPRNSSGPRAFGRVRRGPRPGRGVPRRAALAARFAALGIPRIAEPGSLQRPSPLGTHGGVRPLCSSPGPRWTGRRSEPRLQDHQGEDREHQEERDGVHADPPLRKPQELARGLPLFARIAGGRRASTSRCIFFRVGMSIPARSRSAGRRARGRCGSRSPGRNGCPRSGGARAPRSGSRGSRGARSTCSSTPWSRACNG